MARQRRFAGRGAGRIRRPMDWAGSISAVAETSVPGNSSVIGTLVPKVGWEGKTALTIVRIRGVMRIRAGETANDEVVGAYGIIVVKETARVAGVASVPKPGTDGDSDWMYWTPFFNKFLTAVEGRFPMVIPIDTKAMRKVDPQADALIEVVQNLTADAFQFASGHHILLKE